MAKVSVAAKSSPLGLRAVTGVDQRRNQKEVVPDDGGFLIVIVIVILIRQPGRLGLGLQLRLRTLGPGSLPRQKRSALQEFRHRLGARADLKFFVDAADIGMHRLVADFEFVGDFLVDQTLREQIEHLLFAFGQVG